MPSLSISIVPPVHLPVFKLVRLHVREENDLGLVCRHYTVTSQWTHFKLIDSKEELLGALCKGNVFEVWWSENLFSQ